MGRSVDNPIRIGGVSLLLFCFSLFLASYTARNPSVAGVGSSLVQQLLHPFQSATRSVYATAGDLWSGYVALVNTAEENHLLRSRVKALEAHNAALQELAHENQRLKGLMKITDENFLRDTTIANVIGYDASNWVKSISIDKGARDGIKPGQPVLGIAGVVGQVIAAASRSARVLLLTDHASGIDAIVQSSRARGIVEGMGGATCRWRFVLASEEVKIGDRVVTSGADGIFPKGLLLGVVSSVDDAGKGIFRSVEIDPAEDFLKLESVTVLTSQSGARE